MGSVPDLYTTGDNDPEIHPVRYYRHYLYCDACGSFELEPWMKPENLEEIESKRRRLSMAALIAAPLVVMPAWSALGLFPSAAFLLLLVAAIVIVPVLRGRGWRLGKESVAWRWRFVRRSLLWLLVATAVEWIASDLVPDWLMLLAGLAVVVGLLVAREVLGSKVEHLGLRCRPCGSTYAYGTPFFTDLDANPRHLAVADVPRPLGSSPFEQGKYVGEVDEPPEAWSRLPP